MTSSLPARRWLAPAALAWALLAVVIVLVNLGNILARRFPDPDDMLRLVQVRDLITGQSWFDLHQYRIDSPAGTLMHWSRLVDVPLAAIILVLTPLLGSDAAEMGALIAVPLLTLGVILLMVARIASRFFDREVTAFGCLSLGLSPLLVAQIQPLRIDHHGWQIASVTIALAGLLSARDWRGPALSGTALAVGLSISLEVLPLTAGFGAVFAFRWLTAGDNRALPAFLTALTGTLVLLFAATRGVADLAMHCDSVAPAHLGALAVTTALTVVVARIAPRLMIPTIVLLGMAAIVGLASYLALAPQCTAGPFGRLDPLVRHFWYDNVGEGLPVWTAAPGIAVPVVLTGLMALAVLAHLARIRPAIERRWWREYLAVATVAFLSGLLVWRSQAFVGALSAIPIGWLAVRLLERLRVATTRTRKIGAAMVLALVLVPALPTTVASALAKDQSAVTGDVTDSDCELARSIMVVNQLPAGRIFAPLDIGPEILVRSDHSVVATGHHRAEQAMRDVIEAFTSPAPQARSLVARHRPDYLVLCTDLAEALVFRKEAPHGLAADLARGRAPGWLERIQVDVPVSMQVWRVRGS